VGEDWHEFFEDFPDMDPANDKLSEAELEALTLRAPGWRWVDEASERYEAQRRQAGESGADPSVAPDKGIELVSEE